ncbi:unnamed protein product [Phytophthora fragariaefolia]|uniref:Unnamed protein product n=1 Tax=Phytophthora fragariaefolia TaxID=1490495 RepID=A0A9W6TYM8_9STRA|nr:unnamed protein product [Phytophthora fragariaefolia]
MLRLCVASLFVVANLAKARVVPLSPNIFDAWRASYHVRDVITCVRDVITCMPCIEDVRDVVHDQEPLEDQIARYTREGEFPKAGRALQAKIDEANEFLDRELAIEEQRGVGVSGAIVYQDQVLLSKGHVTSRTLFQIGSVSKTFISFGIAIMVEEGKLSWDDPVKKHLPSFKLFDKYAEKYVTIGDLCAMNSGLNDLPDVGHFFGVYRTDEDLVAGLAHIEPAHTLRGGHDYANSNFAILGQVIKNISGKQWDIFLKERIWDPLGMTRTFASAFDAQGENDSSYGHFECGGNLMGPYNLVEAPEAQLAGHGQGHKIASGSTLSSSDDLATLLRLILNKGTVNGITIFRDPATVTNMITGKYAVNKDFVEEFLIEGHQYNPDGNTLASGYGFDYVGHGQWGHAYIDKSGDTAVHVTRTGIAPDANLGVVLMSNTQTPGGHLSYPLDHIRSYVMGIFLDVPKDILGFSSGVRLAMVGKYVAQSSTDYFGSLEVREEEGNLVLAYGALSAPLMGYINNDNKRILFWDYKASPLLIKSRKWEGNFELEIGVVFRQVTKAPIKT